MCNDIWIGHGGHRWDFWLKYFVYVGLEGWWFVSAFVKISAARLVGSRYPRIYFIFFFFNFQIVVILALPY